MRTHLTDGELRAALDGELDAGRLHHLEACAACQARRQQAQARQAVVARRLAALSAADETGPPARAAWARLARKAKQPKEYSMTRTWLTNPLVRFGTAALALLLLVAAFPGTRALAGEFLNLFRAQQVTVVPVDFTGLEQLTGDGALGSQFTQLIANSIVVEREPGDAVEAGSAEQASQLAGFTVRVPAGMAPSQIHVADGAAFSLRVDRTRAQALLDAAGRSDLVLPASVDGAEISVDIAASVSVAFGTCPRPGSGVSGNTEQSATERRYPGCVILVQMPGPSVSAPAGLDIDQLAQIGLEFTGMSPAEAAAFTSTVDWTSTLVVPIPEDAAVDTQVAVDGVTGTLVQRAGGETPQYALLWVKDGIIYAISGLGTNGQQAIDMANALP